MQERRCWGREAREATVHWGGRAREATVHCATSQWQKIHITGRTQMGGVLNICGHELSFWVYSGRELDFHNSTVLIIRGVMRGQGGAQYPGRRKVPSTFFSTSNLFPKDLKFEQTCFLSRASSYPGTPLVLTLPTYARGRHNVLLRIDPSGQGTAHSSSRVRCHTFSIIFSMAYQYLFHTI